MNISENHIWNGKKLREIALPQDTLALILKRNNHDIVPKGNTLIKKGDSLIISAPSYNSDDKADLDEITITQKHPWCEKHISELDLPQNTLIDMIKRNGKTVLPRGKTKLKTNDIITIFKQN